MPPQPHQPHHVINPQPAARAAARRRTGRSAGGSRPRPAAAGASGGCDQSWPRWLNSSGGAPTDRPRTSRSWCAQASAPPGCTPTARSRDDPGVHARGQRRLLRRGQLLVGQPLQPGVELGRAGPAGRGRAARVAGSAAGGPVAPVGPVPLGQRAPGGPVLQRRGLRARGTADTPRAWRSLSGSRRMISRACRLAAHTASRSIRSGVALAARSGAASAATRSRPAASSCRYSAMSSIRR